MRYNFRVGLEKLLHIGRFLPFRVENGVIKMEGMAEVNEVAVE